MNALPIIVADPDELLNSAAFGAGSLVRIESSATGGGAGYSEIGTLAILASTYEYTYYDTAAPTGQWYRTRYSNSGNTNRSDYSAERQAPTVTGLCSVYEVRSRQTGDNPNDGGQFVQTLAAKILEISADIERMVGRERGVSGDWHFLADASASARTFAGRSGGSDFLSIDDCVAVSSVALVDPTGATVQALTAGTDYVVSPANGAIPITGLLRIGCAWPVGVVVRAQVSARWGFATAIPYDAREAAIIEVIRSYNADRGGNNDAVGVTPFGTTQFSKAYASKTSKLVADYRHGGGFLR